MPFEMQEFELAGEENAGRKAADLRLVFSL
jgi:hypothetical protein